jgi:tetratricopeptide (TPR) repeat protein
VRDDARTIAKTLDSLAPLDSRIVVGDLGSKDSTIDICLGYGAEIVRIPWAGDYSAARNKLVSEEGMNLMVEPWERLVRGHEEILETDANSNITVVRSEYVSKELRLWRGRGFTNPVYETIDDDGAGLMKEAALVCSEIPDRRREAIEICSAWRERRPTSPDPWYYSAFSCLSLGKIDEFLSCSEKYLAMTKKFSQPEIQMTYQMSRVLFARGQQARAAGLAARCLLDRPTFAEFWCLLGDMFYVQKKYAKSRSMYENAMIIGSRRSSDDPYPLDLEKYKKHPERMIDAIDRMDKTTGTIVTKRD